MSLRFGAFELDDRNRELRRAGEPVPIQPKVFDCLELLVRRPGQLVTARELHAALWKGVHVGPEAIRRVIRDVRLALGDDGRGQAWIRTRKGVGYVFVGAVDEPRRPGFVGREMELGALTGVVAALSGDAGARGAFCLIAGEAGAGKTSLVSRLPKELTSSGAIFCVGECQPGEGVGPFWPWRQIGTQLLEDIRVRPAVERLAPGPREALRRFADTRSSVSAPGSGADAESRFLLCVALVDALTELAAAAPLVLTVEDLHWADEGTLLLLETLSRATRRHPIAVLSTYRSERVVLGSAIEAFLGRVTGREGVTAVEVGPLSESEIGQLLAQRPEAEARFTADAVRQLTGGNALFVHQLLANESARPALRGAASGERALPASLRFIVAERVGLLAGGTRRLLGCAAVLGHEFTLAMVASMARVEPHEALQQLQPAIAAGLVAHERGASLRLRFAHELLRDALYATLPLGEQQRHHLEALRAWEAAPPSADRTSALATHAFLAGSAVSAARTRELCATAGREASEALAFDRAALHLERALALEPAPSRGAAELAVLSARAHLHADHPPAQVTRAFRHAAHLARQACAPRLFAEAALGAAVGDDSPIELAFAASRLDEVALLDEALTMLGARGAFADGETDAAGPVTHQVARALAWIRSALGEHEGARAAARAARASAPPPASTFAHGLAQGLACMEALWDGDALRAERLLAAIAASGPGLGLGPRRRIELTLQTMVLGLHLGDLPVFAAARNRLDAETAALPQPPRFGRLGERLALYTLAPSMARVTLATIQGDFQAAGDGLAAAMARVALLELPPARDGDNGVAFLLPLFGYQGRAQMLEPMLAAAAPGDLFALTARAQIALERGQRDEATACFDALRAAKFRRATLAEDAATTAGRVALPSPQTLVAMADVCVAVGRAEDAAELTAMLGPAAGYCAVEGIAVSLGSNARPLGELAALMGRFEVAEAHLQKALEMNRHHRPERARTMLALSRTLAATGRREESAALASSARRDAEAMGMVCPPA